MAKKIALITGANRGIGLETARQLANQGVKVLLAARDIAKADAAAKNLSQGDLDVVGIELDPTSASSIAKAVQRVEKEYGYLDILINNAGTLVEGDFLAPSDVDISVFRETYEINVFALHEVTKSFWSLLNKSKAARLVNVSSMLGSLGCHAEGMFDQFKVIAYDSSKAAVNMMTLHYAHQWKGTPHKANTIHPGSVKTDLNPNGQLAVEDGAKTSVRLATIGSDGPNGGFFYMDDTVQW